MVGPLKTEVSSIAISMPSVTSKPTPYFLYVYICNFKYIYVVQTQVLFYSLYRISTWLSTSQGLSDDIAYLNTIVTIQHTHLYGENKFIPSLK